MIERESEAWRALAEWYDTRAYNEMLCGEFLCLALEWRDGVCRTIAKPTADAMMQRIALDIGQGNAAYETRELYRNVADWLSKDEAHNARVLACLMFAEEAEGEGR